MGASELSGEYKKLRKWARDNLTPVCCFCGQWIDRDLKYPHPQSWSANHIVPVSKAPELAYDRDNIAPSHFVCNSRAQDRTPKPTRTEIDW